ncbi:MAG: hypothetical protein L0K02_03145 [Corynebacterium sp.]|nr:hypothetical protein [Corynebacterium sp.]
MICTPASRPRWRTTHASTGVGAGWAMSVTSKPAPAKVYAAARDIS